MKKSIEGKMYNTETATMVADYWNGLGSSDWTYLKEELYRTKKGAWFLYGVGGPMSRYGKSEGSQSWGSSDIIPMDSEEAFSWCEEHNKIKVIEEYFPHMIDEA